MRWLVVAALLAGCQAPTAAGLPGSVPVQVRVAPTYGLQALLTAYTSASIDHVRLTLLADTGGSYVATGASVSVAQAGLGSPVALGSLRMGTRYRIHADAYASATEAASALISDPATSLTDFTTPAASTSNGVQAVDDAPVALHLGLKLLDQTYAGSASVTVSLASSLRSKVSTVTLVLKAGTTVVSSKTYPVASVSAGALVPLSNLRMDTPYTLEADGYSSAGQLKSSASTSTLSFRTAAVANNQIDTAVGTLTVPCK